MTPDLNKINKEGMERARLAKERLTTLGYEYENLSKRHTCYYEMFPHEFLPSHENVYLLVARDSKLGMFVIRTPSGTFITATKFPSELQIALNNPKNFYKCVTGKEWPYEPIDRSPAPALDLNVDAFLGELF